MKSNDRPTRNSRDVAPQRASQWLNERRDDLIAECQSSSLVDVVDCRRLISASHPLRAVYPRGLVTGSSRLIPTIEFN